MIDRYVVLTYRYNLWLCLEFCTMRFMALNLRTGVRLILGAVGAVLISAPVFAADLAGSYKDDDGSSRKIWGGIYGA